MAAGDPLFLEAIQHLQWLFQEAHRRSADTPDVASLATLDVNGRPSVRSVTIVAIETEGPAFFFNRNSQKGRHLAENPHAALCFFWPELDHQVTVEGRAQAMDTQTADRLWMRRSRDSKLAAWINEMEPPAGEPDTLAARLHEIRCQFAWDRVPRPASWQGIWLTPDVLDFWHVVWHRPRPREHYCPDENGVWQKQFLQPL